MSPILDSHIYLWAFLAQFGLVFQLKVESPSEMSNGLRLLIKQENQVQKHITSAMDWTRFKICVLCPEVLIKHQLADILPNF